MVEPVLVTGSHRSGTTWLGRLLCLSGELFGIREPFNPRIRLVWLEHPPEHWYQYLGPENGAKWDADIERLVRLRMPVARQLATVRTPREAAVNARETARWLVARARRAGALVKDPIAFFGAEYFAAKHGFRVVVLIRHPAAFAGSLKTAGWRFQFKNLAQQPLLLDRYLSDVADEVRVAADHPPDDVVDQAILLWRCVYGTAAALADAHPEWIVRRYEDIATSPVDSTRDLYQALGLRWTDRVERGVRRLSEGEDRMPRHTQDVHRKSSAQIGTWHQRLTAEEEARVRHGTAAVADRFYNAADWLPQ